MTEDVFKTSIKVYILFLANSVQLKTEMKEDMKDLKTEMKMEVQELKRAVQELHFHFNQGWLVFSFFFGREGLL